MKNATRFGAFWLCVAMLVSFLTSCGRQETQAPTYLQNHRLNIETVEVKYTDAFFVEVPDRIAALTARGLLFFEGLLLTDAEKSYVADTVRNRYLVILQEIPITEQELSEILTLGENALTALEQGEISQSTLLTVLDSYQELVRILDAERAGHFVYEVEHIYIKEKIAYLDHRYETYGYPWYLEDADRCRAQLTALETQLGRETFAKAAGIVLFGGSLCTALLKEQTQQSSEGLLSAGDLLALLQRQSATFAAASITPEQWQLMAALFAPLLRTNTQPLGGELEALREAAYFERIAALLPQTFDFYDACVASLSVEDLQALQQKNDTVMQISTLCRVISQNETAFVALLQRFAAQGATDNATEQAAIRKAGLWNEYEAFLAAHPVCDAEALAAAVAACADTPCEESVKQLKLKTMGYLCGVAPCLCYVLAASMTSV